ncbi:hypothetical protein [Salinilacihabitans rarus]|uniref:hypothetical protein n=1 Tax=Salinilacihabitans rarus TaxID=2961596 RepID=UPI0020C8F5BA|nr:hypothetical protein [Salinilacihabitans rarus]
MVLRKLLGSRATRAFTVGSVLLEAKRAVEGGNRFRAAALLVVAVFAWKWTVLGVAAQGVVKLLRAGR